MAARPLYERASQPQQVVALLLRDALRSQVRMSGRRPQKLEVAEHVLGAASSERDPVLHGIAFVLHLVEASAVGAEGVRPRAEQALSALVTMGLRPESPEPAALEGPFGRECAEALCAAWPIVRALAIIFDIWTAAADCDDADALARLEEMADEMFNETGIYVLLSGCGDSGAELWAAISRSCAWRFAPKDPQRRAELVQALQSSMVIRPMKAAGYLPRGSVASVVRYAQATASSRLADASLEDLEGPSISTKRRYLKAGVDIRDRIARDAKAQEGRRHRRHERDGLLTQRAAARAIGLSESTFRYRVKALRDANAVLGERRGSGVYYTVAEVERVGRFGSADD